MLGVDRSLEGLGNGSVWLALALAVLLGVRHATDPDHLTAVTTLVLSDDELGTRRAGRLGAAWGLGHGTTLLMLGLPVVLFGAAIPAWAQRAVEALIGVVIVVLAVRLIVRFTRAPRHSRRLGRTPLAAYGVGSLHGLGGSAAAGVLLVATVPGTTAAAIALVLFACASALSMSLASMAWARVLATPPVLSRLVAVAPVFGVTGVFFGSWYGLGALA